MFKKIILGFVGLSICFGMLGDVPNAEARKYRNHYKSNYNVELDGVSADVVRELCEIYPCGWEKDVAVFYQGHIIVRGRKMPVFFAKRGSKAWMRTKGVAHKEDDPWENAKIKGRKIYINGRRYKIKNITRTDGGGGHTKAKSNNDYIPTRYVKRACLKRRRCRKALYRYARKHSKKSRYIPTSRRVKRHRR